jgi:hypothetical protein
VAPGTAGWLVAQGQERSLLLSLTMLRPLIFVGSTVVAGPAVEVSAWAVVAFDPAEPVAPEEQADARVVRFTPKLSLSSPAKAGARLTVLVRIQGPAAAKGAVRSLTVQVSYDGGRTWKQATVHTAGNGSRSLTLTHPAKPGTVSLKATLVDTSGNTMTETLSNAYRTVR